MRGVAGVRSTGILFQDGVLDPVQAVLDLPVAADHLGDGLCLHEAAADVEHVLGIGFSAPGAGTMDGNDRREVWPVAEGGMRRCGEDLHSTRGHPVAGALRVAEGAVWGRCAEAFRRGEEVGLVSFERDQVVGAGLSDERASFFRQCSASAVTPAPVSWALARIASTMCASLSSLFS